MRYTTGFLTVILLAGCAGSPPKPPEPKGEYRPVNRSEAPSNKAIPVVFDYSFEGDIINALPALRASQPNLIVAAPHGKPTPLLVRVNLRATTLENALRAIGEQGGDVADVVWNTSNQKSVNEVFIRYRTTEHSAEETRSFEVK